MSFDPYAEDYERHAAAGGLHALYDRSAVLGLLGDVSGLAVLDAGCGSGIYLQALVAWGADVVGFDASPEMIRKPDR